MCCDAECVFLLVFVRPARGRLRDNKQVAYSTALMGNEPYQWASSHKITKRSCGEERRRWLKGLNSLKAKQVLKLHEETLNLKDKSDGIIFLVLIKAKSVKKTKTN